MKRFLFIFILTAVTYNTAFCMQEGNQPKLDLINLGIIAGPESQYDNSAFIKKNLVDRDNEYQQDKAELANKLNYFRQTFGSLENVLTINSHLSISSKVIFWGGLSLIGLNRLLPLACQAVERFWRLHPRLSFLTSCLGFGASGFGMLMLLLHSGHSKCLREYQEVILNSQYLANLEPYINNDNQEEKED